MEICRGQISRWVIGAAATTLVLIFSLGISPALGQDISKARKQNQAHLKQCTERHGYDPEKSSSLGPHELGTGEREWRECVYEGIEKYLIPNTLSPDAYRKAIAEDRELTANLAAGKVTRAQRRARVEKIIAELEAMEKKNQAKIDQQVKTATGLAKSEMQRQQDLMRMQDMRGMMRSLAR